MAIRNRLQVNIVRLGLAAPRMSSALLTLPLAACGSTQLVSTWRAPDAAALEMQGSKVGALVLMQDDAMRRLAEDALAREITARGAQGVPLHTVLPAGQPASESEARAACERAGIESVIVMRPVSTDRELVSTPTAHLEPTYGTYWDGYYGFSSQAAYQPATSGMEIKTNVTVTVETLVYSLEQNKLVWAGKSKTTNPQDIAAEIKKLAVAVAKELKSQRLIGARS